MNRLILMVGLPGCGKSTYAKKLIETHPDWIYISRDDIRYEWVTDQAHYFDHEKDVFREFCNRIDMHLMREETVIADATHINAGSRSKLLKSLKVVPDETWAIWIDTPFDLVMERNSAREGIIRVPDKTMYEMKNRFRPPATYENFDKIYRVKG